MPSCWFEVAITRVTLMSPALSTSDLPAATVGVICQSAELPPLIVTGVTVFAVWGVRVRLWSS